jgi:hypothetical protein
MTDNIVWIWHPYTLGPDAEVVDSAENLSAAKQEIDHWVEGSVR